MRFGNLGCSNQPTINLKGCSLGILRSGLTDKKSGMWSDLSLEDEWLNY